MRFRSLRNAHCVPAVRLRLASVHQRRGDGWTQIRRRGAVFSPFRREGRRGRRPLRVGGKRSRRGASRRGRVSHPASVRCCAAASKGGAIHAANANPAPETYVSAKLSAREANARFWRLTRILLRYAQRTSTAYAKPTQALCAAGLPPGGFLSGSDGGFLWPSAKESLPESHYPANSRLRRLFAL